ASRMPSRILSLVIVLFWLATGVWLFVRDLWPKFRPGEPPLYTFMASDEAPRQGAPNRWNVFHNGRHAYDIEAATSYREKGDTPANDDTFEMKAFLRVKQEVNQKPPMLRLHSLVRITRDGELREVNADLHMGIQELECLFDIEGLVDDKQLLPRWRI